MSLLKTALVVALGFAVQVASHGHVTSVSCTGKTTPAFNPYPYEWKTTPTCSWRDHGIVDKAFILSSEYSSGDINCHVGATPADLDVEVVAGQEITMQWTPWPESHHGPVITYLAACNGDCSEAKLDEMMWNKIDAVGQISVGTTNSDDGVWAADLLREGGNKATVKIPASIKAGNYLCRHEIIFLNSNLGETQHYPNCINLKISGSGTDPLPSGTKGVDLYTERDPGIKVMVYGTTLKYQMPGPPLYAGASSGDMTSNPTPGTPVPYDSVKTPPATHTPTAPGKPSSAHEDTHTTTPYATGTMPSYSSQPTGTKPPGHQPSGMGLGAQATPKDSSKLVAYTNPKADGETSEHPEDSSTKNESNTSTKPSLDTSTTPKSQYTSTTADSTPDKSADSDVKVPAGASFSQLLDTIERAVSALRKMGTGHSKRRRHARDVIA